MLLLGSLIDSCKNWSAYCSGPMVVSNLMKQVKKFSEKYFTSNCFYSLQLELDSRFRSPPETWRRGRRDSAGLEQSNPCTDDKASGSHWRYRNLPYKWPIYFQGCVCTALFHQSFPPCTCCAESWIHSLWPLTATGQIENFCGWAETQK